MRPILRTASLLAPIVLATSAFAQLEPPPEPTFTPSTSPIIGYLVAAVLFGIIVSVSLMPSKRSHTDL
jgi:hypothetical protein